MIKENTSHKYDMLVVVPARAGSKGLENKNLRILREKPLLGWTIEAFKNSGVNGKLVVSSDSEEILRTAEDFGAHGFKRNPRLATDEASSVDVLLEVIGEFSGFTTVMMLQPTSPLRTAEHITSALKVFENSGATSLLSGYKQRDKSLWGFKIEGNNQIIPHSKDNSTKLRQDLPEIFMPNGAIYISYIESFILKKSFIQDKTTSFIMPEEDSIDIDTLEDFNYADYKLSCRFN
jgi:CMP-N,N'-diacetyllegionaminic acid synthase